MLPLVVSPIAHDSLVEPVLAEVTLLLAPVDPDYGSLIWGPRSTGCFVGRCRTHRCSWEGPCIDPYGGHGPLALSPGSGGTYSETTYSDILLTGPTACKH